MAIRQRTSKWFAKSAKDQPRSSIWPSTSKIDNWRSKKWTSKNSSAGSCFSMRWDQTKKSAKRSYASEISRQVNLQKKARSEASRQKFVIFWRENSRILCFFFILIARQKSTKWEKMISGAKKKFLIRSFFFLERSVALLFPVEMLSSVDDGWSRVRAPKSDQLVSDVLAFVQLVKRVDEFASRFFS